MKKQAIPFILLALVLVGLVALRAMTYLRVPVRPQEAQVKNRPIQVLENGYVSSNTCEACHPHEHATWHSSYHRTMTQVATPETVLGDQTMGSTGHFDGEVQTCLGKEYRLGRDGDRFWVELPSKTDRKDEKPDRRELVMTTGSHHMQAYW